MKIIVFLAFAALTQSFPYSSEWNDAGTIYRPDVGLHWSIQQRPWSTVDPTLTTLTQERPIAEGSARNIIKELVRDYDVDIEELIDRLGKEQHLAGTTNNPKTARAIGELRQELREEEKKPNLDDIRLVQQLKDTLAAAIEAQLTTDKVDKLKGGFTKTADQDNAVFEARIKKLIDRLVISDLESELTKQQKIIRQLDDQERFLEQQKQQLEAQKTIVREIGQGVSTGELRVAEQRIKEELRRLVSEKFARYLVVKMLREKLFEVEDKFVKDSIIKALREDALEERRDFGRRTTWDTERTFYRNPWQSTTGLRFYY